MSEREKILLGYPDGLILDEVYILPLGWHVPKWRTYNEGVGGTRGVLLQRSNGASKTEIAHRILLPAYPEL